MNRQDIINKLLGLFFLLDFTIDPMSDMDKSWRSLGVDSLEFVELIMNVETQFGITITNEQAADLRTPGELLDHICAAKGLTVKV